MKRRNGSALLQVLARPRHAQAFITTCNLPDTVAGLRDWVGEDPWTARTPVDNVLDFEPTIEFLWTAPQRVGVGDIAFFHFAARAAARVKSLRRAAAREGALDAGLEDFLDCAAEHADSYAGRIFAYGVLGGPAQPETLTRETAPHWRSRLYAPIRSVTELPEPLLIADHTDVLTQPNRTITELTASRLRR